MSGEKTSPLPKKVENIFQRRQTSMSSCERLKEVRRTLGLTQVKFAERIGIASSYLAEMELGKKRLNDRTIRLINMEFNVNEHGYARVKVRCMMKSLPWNLAKATSLFKSLTTAHQGVVLALLNALADLQNTDKR
jgi:transcriptional regulator with XRE-family HTH domain